MDVDASPPRPEVAVAVGFEALVNDVRVARRGVHGSVGLDLDPFTFEASIAEFPNLGDLDLSEIAEEIRDDDDAVIRLNLSRVMTIGRLGAVAWPLRVDQEIDVRVGIAAAGALVYTVDDVGEVGNEREWHPTLSVGLRAEARGDSPFGLRVRFERIAYTNEFGDSPDDPWNERRRTLWLGIDLTWTPK